MNLFEFEKKEKLLKLFWLSPFIIFAIVILIAILLSSCRGQQLTKVYYKQFIDVVYIPIDRIDIFEHRTVKNLCKELKIPLKDVIRKVKKTKDGKYDCYYILNKINCKFVSYIPVKYEHMNMKNEKGRIILKNKYRNNLIYDEIPK